MGMRKDRGCGEDDWGSRGSNVINGFCWDGFFPFIGVIDFSKK